MMNDEFYDNHENIREAWHQQLSQDDSYRSGLRFARRIRLARIVGLAALFVPLASVLVSQFLSGVWWLLLVGWVFVWPHLAWQLAFRSAEPHSSEIVNLKIDAIIAGVWMGLTGFNALPTAALIVMIGMNMMGSGGCRLFLTGLALLALSALLTVQSTGTPVVLTSEPLALWLTLPVLVVYPILFAWLSHRTAIRLAEHKRRLELMSTRDGMTGVFNRRHWETLLRNEFEACRRSHRQATILLIDIDHFKTINDTWGHDVGDEAIVAITRQLQLTLRSGDYIGRFGGDEFAVIMSGTPADSAIAAMSRVHERLVNMPLHRAPMARLCISVGVAPWGAQFTHYREWLKAADVALYKAKNAGRGRTEVAA
ncbi:diguanylate cyclase [Enterobacter hormaechei subsp. steigerwaltii]|uniref:diguanylate cyclase AdrA n=1 Tax=Enterobacter cloacae complex TaxID=354276 RepID=UPI000649EAFB|nr:MULTISPECIES: diguanylate cyclase AdrA [Enterobacter cloacae complex]MBT1831220.1 diguanylate cyclase AdrA [Enterobacter hormaechei subsp. xiangfangensis]CAF9391214.1 putative diguanylate cyclase AdrA [Enterobacter cloacae]ELT6636567.1 diguanylate cyclase AdrA [Enterobacter hormaechei]ELT6637941.1 diguanylate cyclase AdrA [Enterobacter hormaechei]KLP79218.1 diguanylate cyclase [Enterobacter hormaechei subsp. steigerwaltii]